MISDSGGKALTGKRKEVKIDKSVKCTVKGSVSASLLPDCPTCRVERATWWKSYPISA